MQKYIEDLYFTVKTGSGLPSFWCGDGPGNGSGNGYGDGFGNGFGYGGDCLADTTSFKPLKYKV